MYVQRAKRVRSQVQHRDFFNSTVRSSMHPMSSPQRSVLLHKEDTKKRKSRDEADVSKTQSIFLKLGKSVQFWW